MFFKGLACTFVACWNSIFQRSYPQPFNSMEDYNKIIESLSVRFLKAKNIKMVNPFVITNFYDVENSVFLLHDGDIVLRIGQEDVKVQVGDVLFVPGGKQACIGYGVGSSEGSKKLSNEEFVIGRDKYFESNYDKDKIGKLPNSFSYITFAAKVFDSVNFFTSLDINSFIIPANSRMARLITEIVEESLENLPGKERVIQLKSEEIVIGIIRYVLSNNLFVEKLATNSTYFKDPRLIDIFNYIKKYLSGDLSNKVLASVANVSEDYVGQYFKMLTGINPQDYIEYQRMEKAVDLLRTSKKSIREIGQDVGYKDTAYFCRRFKMMFGIPAGKMRKRESLMNI